MAKYKSRVKNKYMGSGFEGYVASARTSEGLLLAKKLQESALTGQKLLNVKIGQDKDEAIDTIQTLYASGKKMEDIQAEILAGKHPNLTGKFIEKTTQFHLGKVKAAETIKSIEANKNTYDFKAEGSTLNKFYEQFLPNFDESDNSFTAGFASAFNGYKADEAIKDAEKRSLYASEKKISEGVTILDSIPTEKLNTDLVVTWNSLGIEVPNTNGSSTPNKLYTNDELQKVLTQSVAKIISEAKTENDLIRADIIFNTDLGFGKDGTPLKTLGSRNTNDVLKLKELLEKKRNALQIEDRREADVKEDNEVKEIFAIASTDIEETTSDGTFTRKRTYEEQLELREKLEEYGNPKYLTAFDTLIDNERTITTDPSIINEMIVNIYQGGYDNQEDLLTDLTDNNVDVNSWKSILGFYSDYKSNKSKGDKMLHLTNDAYLNGINTNLISVRGNYLNDRGFEKPNYGEARKNARFYMIKEIYAFEQRMKEDKEWQTMSEFDKNIKRIEFMNTLGGVTTSMFKDDTSPDTTSFEELEIQENKKTKELQDKKIKYNEMGITPMISNTSENLEADLKGFKATLPKTSDAEGVFGLGKAETNFIPFDQPNTKDFNMEYVVPFLETQLKKYMGDNVFTKEMMEGLDQADYSAFRDMIIDTINDPRVNIETVEQALKNIAGIK